jgi:hypothetical protein
MLAMMDDEASVESIYDDMQAGRAEQHSAGDLLSYAELGREICGL